MRKTPWGNENPSKELTQEENAKCKLSVSRRDIKLSRGLGGLSQKLNFHLTAECRNCQNHPTPTPAPPTLIPN